jgi:heptosyltransferase-2
MTERSRSVVIVQTGFLGDVALATGIVRALASAGVERIGMVVRSELAAMLEGHPAIDTLHRLDKRAKGSSRAMADELRAARYDAALVPHRSARSSLLAWRAGIPRRVGFRQAELALLHTDRVHYSIAAHELERNAMLVERLGFDVSAESRLSWLEPQEGSMARVRARGFESAVLVAPGSVWATKRWREDSFVELVRALARDGRRVLVVGGADDRALCDAIARAAGISADDVLAGETSLADLVALCAIASRVICNDSAPLHVAEAAGTPVTAIFGPTVPEIGFAPFLERSSALGVALPCRPCRIHGGARCPIGTHECMRAIGAEEVLGTIR